MPLRGPARTRGVSRASDYSIRWGAPGGGFIVGSSHSLAVGCKPANLMKMKECREKYGGYPISIPE